jgi:hypothetical protein
MVSDCFTGGFLVILVIFPYPYLAFSPQTVLLHMMFPLRLCRVLYWAVQQFLILIIVAVILFMALSSNFQVLFSNVASYSVTYFVSVKMFTGSSVALSHDTVFASLSASDSSCEVFADTAVIHSGIARFDSVKLAGYIGHCTISFVAYFPNGQKATIETRYTIITRELVSPVISQILPVTNRATVDVPFMIPGICHFFVVMFTTHITQSPYWPRMTRTTP